MNHYKLFFNSVLELISVYPFLYQGGGGGGGGGGGAFKLIP